MMNKIIAIAIVMLVGMGQCFAQEHMVNKANKLYEKQAYAAAIEPYTNYLASVHDVQAMANLAECYRLTNATVEAERFYQVVVKSNQALPVHYFNYAKVLMNNKKYDDAKEWFIEYYKASPHDKHAREYIKACEEIDQLQQQDTIHYRTFNLNINTPQSDFGATFYRDGIVFSSARTEMAKSRKRFGWTNEPYLDLYVSEEGYQDKFREPKPLSEKINSKFHEGPVSFSTAENFMYFTRNNYLHGKTNKSATGIHKLSIYTATLKNEEWKEIRLFEFNNPEYSIGHPSISADGKVLYFVSDMPGGFGGTDIYVSRKLGLKWTKPVNLGIKINTSGNEMFPFIHPDGTLYFASDGHAGLGGLDIFMTRYNGFRWDIPINMKPPFNSSKDDFYWVANEARTLGYFSSNRDGGKGNDDIYYFEKNLAMMKNLKGRVISAITKNPIAEVDIVLQDYLNPDKTNQSDSIGTFQFKIDRDQNYNIVVSKPGYHTKTILFFAAEYEHIEEPYIEIELEESIWFKLEGKISDAETELPIDDVNVELRNQTYSISKRTISTEEGGFNFDLDPQSNYIVIFSKDGYFTETVEDLSTFNKSESEIIFYDVVLGLKKMELNKAIVLKDIYYDLNKWDLKPQAKKECDKLVTILRSNPHITIELSSHTDSRASDDYNLELSQKRANSVAEYIVTKGIEKSRIIPKGYGETKLKNRCRNGVPCPESLHQQNRRTEFTVIGN